MTQSTKEIWQGELDYITKIVGDDWNDSRARTYIAAYIHSLRKDNKVLREDLEMEKAVHARVETALARSLRND